MRADNRNPGDYGITLNPQEGTVAAYLAEPTPPAMHRRIARLMICLAIALFSLAALSMYMHDLSTVRILPFLWSYGFYEMVAGCILTSAAIAVLVYSRIRKLPKEDKAIAVKKTALEVLIKRSRSGVSTSTPMRSVRIRSVRIFGSKGKAVKCWIPGFEFTSQDFSGVHPSDFGAVDFEVADNGCLYVYFDRQIAERLRERRYEKGRG